MTCGVQACRAVAFLQHWLGRRADSARQRHFERRLPAVAVRDGRRPVWRGRMPLGEPDVRRWPFGRWGRSLRWRRGWRCDRRRIRSWQCLPNRGLHDSLDFLRSWGLRGRLGRRKVRLLDFRKREGLQSARRHGTQRRLRLRCTKDAPEQRAYRITEAVERRARRLLLLRDVWGVGRRPLRGFAPAHHRRRWAFTRAAEVVDKKKSWELSTCYRIC